MIAKLTGSVWILALAALVGAAGQTVLSLPIGPILGLTAGLTLYVASSDLLPEVQKVPGLQSTVALLSGVGVFLISARLLPHTH